MLALSTCSVDGDIWDPGETQTLNRLKLALTCKQKAIDKWLHNKSRGFEMKYRASVEK